MNPAQQPPVYQRGAPHPQTVVVQEQAVVTEQPESTVDKRGDYCWTVLRSTGYMQISLGVASVLMGIASISMKTYLYYVWTPIWSGICFFIVAGFLGMLAGNKKGLGSVIGYMVMSILASCAASGVASVAGVAIAFDGYGCPELDLDGLVNNNASIECFSTIKSRVGIDVTLVVIGLVEFVVSIVGASFTCCGIVYTMRTTCEKGTSKSYPQQMVAGAPPQGVYYPPGTIVVYPNQDYKPQGQFIDAPPQVHPEAPLDSSKGEDHCQPLTN